MTLPFFCAFSKCRKTFIMRIWNLCMAQNLPPTILKMVNQRKKLFAHNPSLTHLVLMTALVKIVLSMLELPVEGMNWVFLRNQSLAKKFSTQVTVILKLISLQKRCQNPQLNQSLVKLPQHTGVPVQSRPFQENPHQVLLHILRMQSPNPVNKPKGVNCKN